MAPLPHGELRRGEPAYTQDIEPRADDDEFFSFFLIGAGFTVCVLLVVMVVARGFALGWP